MTKRYLLPLLLAALFAATGIMPSNSLLAQSDLADEDRATVLFDIRMGKMRDGKFMQALEEQMDELQGMAEQTGFDPNSVERIFGAASLPDSMEEFDQPDPPESMQFFVRLKMADADSAQSLFEMMSADGAEEVEMGGKTYMSPEEGFYFHVIEDENTIEIGTEKFLTQASRRLFTKGVDAAFKKTPDFGIRLVADLKSESDLISQVVEMAKANAEPMMAPMIDLIDNASDLSIAIDFDADNLISIAATGNNESDAEELRGGLDGLLGMAKMFGGAAAAEIPDPNAAKMAKEVLDSLEATRDGLNVHIDIPRPEGFEEAVKQGLEMLPMMMMGGGGGFGPDF